jgi:hypothetical protein
MKNVRLKKPFPLVRGQPIHLRSAIERDCKYLASVFAEVWGTIPKADQTMILSRGFGQGIAVDVQELGGFHGQSDKGGDITLARRLIDYFPRARLVQVVAHELAHKLDDANRKAKGYDITPLTPQTAKLLGPEAVKLVGKPIAPARNVERRMKTILRRWGYPDKPNLEHTKADDKRIHANFRANMAAKKKERDER